LGITVVVVDASVVVATVVVGSVVGGAEADDQRTDAGRGQVTKHISRSRRRQVGRSRQASVAAVTGIIAGIPLGAVLGRELWTAFDHNIDAVPDPTVPVLSVVFVGPGALANLVAALPGRSAAHTPTALVLRAE
jgi:hypothetical protein